MAYFTDVEEAKCLLQFEQNHSATSVQRWFYANYGKEAPTRKSIYKWQKSFAETGYICAKKKNSGRRPSGETVWNAFVRRFSVVRRNLQGGQAGNWVMSLT
jgi:hypothetical protein